MEKRNPTTYTTNATSLIPKYLFWELFPSSSRTIGIVKRNALDTHQIPQIISNYISLLQITSNYYILYYTYIYIYVNARVIIIII